MADVTAHREALRALLAAAVCLTALLGSAPPASADVPRAAQWHLAALRVGQAHRITKGAGVTVAVIDSGVRATVPELRGAVLPGTNVLGGDDGRRDVRGHGTAVAGIIAARGRRGMLGIAPAAMILPVRPHGDQSLTAEAIRWAVRHGAKVINMSFGMTASEVMATAVKEAAAADVVLVAGVGNTGDKGNPVQFPAAYPEVLAVGAVDRAGKVPAFSQRGPQVDLVAPGVDVPVIVLEAEGGYGKNQGTSLSAAVVSGAAALIRARYPELPAAEVVHRLTATSIDLGPPGRDDMYGRGSLDLMAALTRQIPPLAAGTAPAHPAASDSAAASTTMPVAADGAAGRDSDGIPPWLFVTIGAVLLLGATTALIVVLRRPS